MVTRKRTLTITVLLGLLGGCAGLSIDPSMTAVEARDLTLISTCSAVPSGGMDACYATEGDLIFSAWRLIVPAGRDILGGEVDVYYRDLHKQYPLPQGSKVIEIPWRDFFNSDKWGPEHDGEVMALALVRWKDATGIEQILKLRGIAKIIVTKPGYDRIPVDSGFVAWKTKFTCTVAYSTAGRSAVKCE